MKNLELGDLVQDLVTGFKGIAVHRVIYLMGCNRIGIQPNKLTKDGKVGDIAYFDEGGLKVLKKKVVKITEETLKKFGTGGATPKIPSIQNPK